MSSLRSDFQTVLKLILPSTQPSAHLKHNPGWKANGENEAKKVPCPKSMAIILPQGGGWEWQEVEKSG